ncbi:hypothetical protein DICSQDRAFT_131313 [Dichomitus squalens LYAD-421 SS1]|uniref:uncharacterized protein n=1 Tax=Dichomitus squalens (strain LYAD-421) TaxID=732165 RepID=UPI00044114C8|nr:uncharacterized protein DICSQDRAFT_131313 [Dichomitus squalens LYAD-421 SS1]EJF67036.1 hypothetical protein DICSQDRAFT_131313 [Dichomitus squalens LYAD-421 SS1]
MSTRQDSRRLKDNITRRGRMSMLYKVANLLDSIGVHRSTEVYQARRTLASNVSI